MNHPIITVARAIDPDHVEYGEQHERTARAHDTAKRVIRELANAKLPHCFMHGGVRITADPRFVSLVRSMLLEVAG
jgi:hypothetical protein